MNYSINVSLNGRFYFEVNRLSDKATASVTVFVAKLRDDYPASEGYLVEVSEKRQTSRRLDI